MTNILLNNLIDKQKEAPLKHGVNFDCDKKHQNNFEKILEKKNEKFEKHIHKLEERFEKFNDKFAEKKHHSQHKIQKDENNSDTQSSVEDPKTEITSIDREEGVATQDVIKPHSDKDQRSDCEKNLDVVQEDEFLGECNVFDTIRDFVVKFVPQESVEITDSTDLELEEIEADLEVVDNIATEEVVSGSIINQVQDIIEEENVVIEDKTALNDEQLLDVESELDSKEISGYIEENVEDSVLDNENLVQLEFLSVMNPEVKSQDKQDVSLIDDNEIINGETNLEIESSVNNNSAGNNIEYDSQILELSEEVIVSKDENQVKELQKTTENELAKVLEEDMLEELNIESFDSDSSFDDNASDLMKNQSPQEQGIKAMIQGDFEMQDFKSEIKPTSNVQVNKPVHEANPSKILDQISKQLDKLQHNSKVNIVLNPESLGKVTIQLINTKEGLSAQFTCATQEARNVLMKGLEGLKETLISQGVNVDNVNVKQAENYNSSHQQNWTEQDGSRGGNKQQNHQRHHHKEEKQLFEQAMFNIEHNNENGKV